VFLGKALNWIVSIFEWSKQIVTDDSSGAAQLVKSPASNQRLQNLGSTPDVAARRCVLRKTPNVILGQVVYLSRWPSPTKDYTQDCSVLEWYDRHKCNDPYERR